MNKTISIIGCGWLGFPLAVELISLGYKVKGSTTTKAKLEQLRNSNIEPYLIGLNETTLEGNYTDFLNKSETLIINIPPSLRKNPSKNHVSEIEHLVDAIIKSGIKNIIYISSTSVFKDDLSFNIITSKTKPNNTTNSAKQIIKIEQLLQQLPNINVTILRFGGLFDTNRHPAKYLAGKTDISNPNAPINLIHKLDCIGIIKAILDKDLWNKSLNAVYPFHSDRKTYYTDYCLAHNLTPPQFNSSAENFGKIVDSSNVVQLLDYTFKIKP